MSGRLAYELFASRLNWVRPDGKPIPRWADLTLAARFKCDALANVALCFEPQAGYEAR